MNELQTKMLHTTNRDAREITQVFKQDNDILAHQIANYRPWVQQWNWTNLWPAHNQQWMQAMIRKLLKLIKRRP